MDGLIGFDEGSIRVIKKSPTVKKMLYQPLICLVYVSIKLIVEGDKVILNNMVPRCEESVVLRVAMVVLSDYRRHVCSLFQTFVDSLIIIEKTIFPFKIVGFLSYVRLTESTDFSKLKKNTQ